MEKLVRSNLNEDAYTYLRELFIDGTRYAPGEKISIEKLSRELGVSRTPLWGAIYRLEAEGIVEIVSRLGVFLIDYDPARVIDIYLAREALEGMAARLAAENISNGEIQALKANLQTQRDHLAKNQTSQYHSYAIEFHELIVKAAQSATLEKMLSSIFAQIKAMQVQGKTLPPMDLPRSCEDHDQLVQAIEYRDANLAEQTARRHIRDLTAQIRSQLREAASAS